MQKNNNATTQEEEDIKWKREVITKFWNVSQVDNNIEGEIEHLSNGRVVVCVTVKDQHLNGYGKLHGGIICTMVDTIGTYALLASQTIEELEPGVSTDMNVSFLNGADNGKELLVDARVLKKGRTLAFVQVDIIDKESKKLIAQGRHTKAIIRPTGSALGKSSFAELMQINSKL
jgi:acyl-coenzyme A thioesterase 13